MLQHDAQAGAFDVSTGPGDVGTRKDLSAAMGFVKSMYPNLEAV